MLRAGIVGLPNVGVVTVPDERLAPLSKIAKTSVIIPATIEVVDIAGLVKGASKGEGLGNKFLSHIREVDAVVQVVRCFESKDIVHVSDHLDPIADIETITAELVLADLDTVERVRDKAEKLAKGGNKEAQAQVAVAVWLQPHLNSGKPALTLEMTDEERIVARGFFLLTMKPTLFACNVAEKDLATADDLPLVKAVRDYAAHHHGSEAVAISAQIEAELAELPEADAKEYLTSLGVPESGVGTLIRAAYHLLGLRTYFTAGEKEVRAWTVKRGATAPQAAGVIHTDFERGFIRAEVIAYGDYIAGKGEAGARASGKFRLEGKEYVVQEGDVMHFRFNV